MQIIKRTEHRLRAPSLYRFSNLLYQFSKYPLPSANQVVKNEAFEICHVYIKLSMADLGVEVQSDSMPTRFLCC